jgi:hypothetical protein
MQRMKNEKKKIVTYTKPEWARKELLNLRHVQNDRVRKSIFNNPNPRSKLMELITFIKE